MKYLLLQTNGIADIIDSPKPLRKPALRKLVGGLAVHACMEGDSGLCAVHNGMQYMDDPPPMPVNPFITDIKGDVVIANYRKGVFRGISDDEVSRFSRNLPRGCTLRRSPLPPPSLH